MSRYGAWLAVLALGLAIIGLHFHGLLAGPITKSLWGISISADPVGDLTSMYDYLTQAARGCPWDITSHSYPFGTHSNVEIHRYLVVPFVVLGMLGKITNNLFLSYNLTIMIVFLVNYLVIYWVSKRLLKDPVTALVPAVLITFSAYAYSHSWAHLGLIPTFYFPCFLYAFTRLQQQPSTKWSIAAAGAIAMSVYTSPYYLYFLVWVAACIIAGNALAQGRKMLRRPVIVGNVVCVAAAVVLGLPYAYQNFLADLSDSWQGPAASNWGDALYFLKNYSARPSDYFLPNVHNPWFGEYFHSFVADATNARNIWSDEFAVSVGVIPTICCLLLLFTLIGRWGARRAPFFKRLTTGIFAPFWQAHGKQPGLVNSLLLIMLVSFLLSFPPYLHILGVQIPMPNEVLRHLVPFRSYSRFALVFLVALATLSGLVLSFTRHPKLLTAIFVATCIFESFPKTMLHPITEDTAYIKYLRSRPERVIMRFEKQNTSLKRVLDLEVILADKVTINGAINHNYGYTELPLAEGFPNFNMGCFGQMGVELLLVYGNINLPEKDRPYMQLLAEFPEDNTQIWKILPGHDPRMTAIFQPFIDKSNADRCYVAPRDEAKSAIDRFISIIRS